MALRELALRRTADRVEDDVQAYRIERVDRAGVEDRGRAAVLHRAARRAPSTWCAAPRGWRGSSRSTWHAVYVETPALQRLDGGRREGILRTVKLAAGTGRAAPPCCRRRDIAAGAGGACARSTTCPSSCSATAARRAWWPRAGRSAQAHGATGARRRPHRGRPAAARAAAPPARARRLRRPTLEHRHARFAATAGAGRLRRDTRAVARCWCRTSTWRTS